MILKVFTIFDAKGLAYSRPFFEGATGSAVRSFIDEVNSTNANSALAAHPEDYTLFEIAEFDQVSAKLMVYEAKKSLGCGVDFKRSNLKEV